jgi:hypothetical protein
LLVNVDAPTFASSRRIGVGVWKDTDVA